ncbi:MAG TPA: hypothetical protein VFV50_09015 [Bdellovibrionales bacterium]|nr:hypothetical protein [Bdellovibrionales bacterium]
MKALALTQFPWPELALVPLVMFFAFFVSMVIWSSLRSTRNRFDQLSLMPLEGEENE